MFYCYVNILGVYRKVISVPWELDGKEAAKLSCGDASILASPSLSADIKAHSSHARDTVGACLAAISSAALLLFERGLPLDCVSVEVNDRIYEISCNGTDLLEIKIEYCKQTFTKTSENVLGAVLDVYDLDDMSFIRACEPSHLSECAVLSLSSRQERIGKPIYAVRADGEGLSVFSLPSSVCEACEPLRVMLSAAELFSPRGRVCRISHDGHSLDVTLLGASLLLRFYGISVKKALDTTLPLW